MTAGAVNTKGEEVQRELWPKSSNTASDPSATDAGATTRYLGSKARVAGGILDIIGQPESGSTFVDAFAGTGVVAREAAIRGWPVLVNDHLLSSCKLAAANLYCPEHVPFASVGGYEQAIEAINSAAPLKGFIWREYSPASKHHAPAERKYFTEENAAKIDGMRAKIGGWRQEGVLSSHEESLLIADLLIQASRVANTAGTFGCFLRSWNQNALQPIELSTRPLLESYIQVQVLNRDVYEVPSASTDVVYLDPPYTKRQYAAYYHVLETIAHGDEPEVDGVTGLRPWKDKASPFCYSRRALSAIKRLVRTQNAERLFLSYSSQGHVELDSLRESMDQLGEIEVHGLGTIGRYTPNDQAREAGTTVTEFLIEIHKSARRSP